MMPSMTHVDKPNLPVYCDEIQDTTGAKKIKQMLQEQQQGTGTGTGTGIETTTDHNQLRKLIETKSASRVAQSRL